MLGAALGEWVPLSLGCMGCVNNFIQYQLETFFCTFRVPFYLGEAIMSPFAAWYLSEMSNPNAPERDNAFIFLKIALHLHTDGLLPKKS